MLYKHKINLKSEKGITLVEIIASIAILSILLITFVTLSQFYLKTDIKQDTKTNALQVAEEVLNELRNNNALDKTGTRNYNNTSFEYEVIEKKIDFTIEEDKKIDLSVNNPSVSDSEVYLYTFLYKNTETYLASVTVSWGE
ncbi:prepilin-type N-terminal cleavage/methylation domain-containing protein [Chengkuizengella sediminis]|uniref:prepilin-type N-terminal cleavage/methylation domain-containing protein n=1 Tax=Chengkuizengella sediminis TaxID=1885917 RepID=UPI00138A0029|nr:prepilin-type N-terminal cleavage/methylation domain-containing protein [Chengkuizengella sediminis]NDI35408.1 hypothetical protein [Chengkuizengella sediminis]